MGFKLADFVTYFTTAIACIVYAMVKTPLFSVVFLALFPFQFTLMGLYWISINKYTAKEFEAYGSGGKIAQEILSSLRTVLALGLQKKAILTYATELKVAEEAGVKKG